MNIYNFRLFDQISRLLITIHILGNAIQTLKAKDPVKVLTIRGTNFEAAAGGGNATVENAPEIKVNESLSSFLGQEITKSDRPELTSAKVIISGGNLFTFYTHRFQLRIR